jgi:hypothetical protein
MIDRISSEVLLGPHDINGRGRSSADREPAEIPQSSLGGKAATHRIFGVTSKTDEYHSRQASS